MATSGVEISSAGTRPNPKGIHPAAVQVLHEKGIDISGQRAKKIEEAGSEFDYAITLCDVADQDCPLLPAKIERLHWSIPDPAIAGDDPVRVLIFFRDVRDDIETRLHKWLGARKLLRETS